VRASLKEQKCQQTKLQQGKATVPHAYIIFCTLGANVVAITCDRLNYRGYCHQLTTILSKGKVLPINLLNTLNNSDKLSKDNL